MSRNEIPSEDENENEIEIENENDHENEDEVQVENENDVDIDNDVEIENEIENENEDENDDLIPTSSPQPCDNPIGVSLMPVAKKMTRKRRRKELKAIREIDFASSSSDAEAFPSVQRRLPLWRAHFNTGKKKPKLAQISSSSTLSEENEGSEGKTKTSKQLEKVAFLLGKKATKSSYAWLGKEVIYELDKIKDERIKRKASWAIQEVLRKSTADDLALRNGLIRSSRLPNSPSTSRHSPVE